MSDQNNNPQTPPEPTDEQKLADANAENERLKKELARSKAETKTAEQKAADAKRTKEESVTKETKLKGGVTKIVSPNKGPVHCNNYAVTVKSGPTVSGKYQVEGCCDESEAVRVLFAHTGKSPSKHNVQVAKLEA